MVDNAEWLDQLAYIHLRDFGSHFSINRMMGMGSVKLRLEREQNLSFLNLITPSFRPMIFWNCAAAMAVRCKWADRIGGKYRWRCRFNPPRGSTGNLWPDEPLITTASGAKMGKTAAGAIG